MAGKIFYRELDREEHPRFLLVASLELNLTVHEQRLRMSELKAIAEATGAELIALPRGEHSGQKRRDAIEARAN